MSELTKFGWWSFKKILGIIVLAAVLILVGRLVLFPLFVARKIVGAATGVVERTLDPDNVIYNYEWFKLKYENYLATENKIENAEFTLAIFKDDAGDRSKWSFEDKNESSRLSSIVLGLQNYIEDIVAEYNAKSRMVNRSIFKMGDKILPERIER